MSADRQEEIDVHTILERLRALGPSAVAAVEYWALHADLPSDEPLPRRTPVVRVHLAQRG